MYESIASNYGAVPAYEPIIRRSAIGYNTARCTNPQACSFVSSNATVIYWSPNVIVLKRLGPGPVTVNSNPSSYWLVNGQRLFADQRVAEPTELFVITDPAQSITLKIRPTL
jgi:hypothetical protein